jgi:transposase
MLALLVEQHAGIPLLMKPLSGKTNDQGEFGRIITEHVQQLRTAPPITSLVADSALYPAENLGPLAQSGLKWITRVPATLTEGHAVLARATPETMTPLADGYRDHEEVTTYGGSSQRWIVVYSEARQHRSRRTVEKQLRPQSEAELKALKPLRRTTCAGAADAQQALEAFTQALPVTRLEGGRIRTVTRYGNRGRPPAEPSSRHGEYVIEGALASSLACRQARLETKSCFILATNELDTTALPAAAVLAGYKKQSTAERGFRFLKDPRFLATALYLKKPERIMALLMVMTICLLGYAALEYRIRQALYVPQETFPDQKGQPVQTPTMRWIFHYFVGIHVLLGAGADPLVLHLNAQHPLVLRLLGAAYEALYS